ncbi:MAG: hypothetical protein IPK16_18665 [Anaerolineales bacterium]|nr:hypothetical protein [Anaerolineales bacterium]
MKQVLDNDLDPFEHRELLTELKLVVATATDPNELRLAESLLAFVQSRDLRMAIKPNKIEEFLERMRGCSPDVLKVGAEDHPGVGFRSDVRQCCRKLIGLVSLVTRQGPFYEAFADFAVVSGKSRYVVTNQTLLMTTQFLVVVVGILALIAVVLLLVGKDTWGVRIGTLGLIFSLCIVNFLVFYFAQLYALVEALGQVLLLIVVALYRWRFLDVTTRQKAGADRGRGGD